MKPENLKEMANPYFPEKSKLSSRKFVGREDEIIKLKAILEDYKRTSNLRNIIISGEKSIGKSCLLNRYKQILQDYNFVVYDVPMFRHPSIAIDEFDFFKDLIGEMFGKYAPPEGDFFDEMQSEIWFSLTSDKYEHESNFITRKITFATQYANRKKGTDETLSYKIIEKDFEMILDELISPQMEIDGLAILIDEFQELSRNPLILEILRKLSEELPGLIVVGAGLPPFLENSIFEKFIRTSTLTNLKGMERDEILDLIFKPLEESGSFSRYEMAQWFDSESIHEIVERSGGNPMHVKALCGKMFDHYQKNPSLEKITLNKAVMEDVMDYYSGISEKSKNIQSSLRSCSKNLLDSFSLLYQYEGFSIGSAAFLELAFKPLTPEEQEIVRKRIIGAFEDIWDLNLYELKDKNLNLEHIIDLSLNSLTHVEYKFNGDTIDKLYASYYYEELTGESLIDNSANDFEDLLAFKLARDLTSLLVGRKIPKSGVLAESPLIKISSGHRHEGCLS